MLRIYLPLALLLATGYCTACTCVGMESVPDALKESSVAFLGTAIHVDTLPLHPEMRGRKRFKVTFSVEKTWKGDPAGTTIVYDIEGVGDCMGVGYVVRKKYLVFAYQTPSKDVQPDPDFFWYGWTDVLPAGSPMLFPITGCAPGGDAARKDVRKQIRQLDQTPRK